MIEPPGEPQRALAVVDLGAVERNCGRLASELSAGVELCAVVKADGYGHGAIECARAALAGGATRLAVATGSEAAELHAGLPDVPILAMGALAPSELELALRSGSEVAVWDRRFADAIADHGDALGIRPRVHVKYDSGMGRLGELDPDAALALASQVAGDPRLELAGCWTHFATADDPASPFFDTQLERFSAFAGRVRERHPDVLLHAANSAATLRDAASHFDMVRCGVAIYGLDPFQQDPLGRQLEPALELRSYVAAVKRFRAGQSAGYGRCWQASSETYVGVLPIGYGDGVRRGLSNNGEVLVDGARRALVGTVSMDNITVDLGPGTSIEPGEHAVVIGAQRDERILAEELASRLETINYEITCGIAPRVPRTYRR